MHQSGIKQYRSKDPPTHELPEEGNLEVIPCQPQFANISFGPIHLQTLVDACAQTLKIVQVYYFHEYLVNSYGNLSYA